MTLSEGSVQRFDGARKLGIERPNAVPFGDESRTWELLELRPHEFRIVVGILAAHAAGQELVTVKELCTRLRLRIPHSMSSLQSRRWIESPGAVQNSRERLWRALPRARRELGFLVWEAQLHTPEEIAALNMDEVLSV